MEESDRVLVMLNTLMDISEAESGAMPLNSRHLQLADVSARAIELYRDVADSKGVSISSEADGTSRFPPIAYGWSRSRRT